MIKRLRLSSRTSNVIASANAALLVVDVSVGADKNHSVTGFGGIALAPIGLKKPF
ncbi:hypothetical protein [Hymenobacter ruricola]|uniref:Uncharacterized protein n=1 Tax=Hymenobacter ruricola TaxID=2791023 RepID=A0ABS0I2W6_9BACT|nr:hypothetical protein [Hymenobacter ruricola]MBF9221313.1 hypothetical protein [Hymenobacter ruricola]